MSIQLLLSYLCAGVDKRIGETTTYQRTDVRPDADAMYYTIPPRQQPNIFDDMEPAIKLEHMPGRGRAKFHTFASGEYRVQIAYAPEIDTVFWRVADT